jgi:hypothetical protein
MTTSTLGMVLLAVNAVGLFHNIRTEKTLLAVISTVGIFMSFYMVMAP